MVVFFFFFRNGEDTSWLVEGAKGLIGGDIKAGWPLWGRGLLHSACSKP
jgi:hypothetical protein